MKFANGTSSLVVGSRVLCMLPHAGIGTIVTIHGEQSGGAPHGAAFDVVFDNGHVALGVPEATVRSVQWRVSDAVYTASQIEAVRCHAAEVGRRRRAERDAASEAHELAVASLRAHPAYSGLTQGKDATGKLAATNLRRQLLAAYPGTRFRVRTAGSGELSVTWKDGPTTAQLQPIISRYLAGAGAPDGFEFVPNPWTEVFGAVRRISTTRTASPALIGRAIEAVFAAYSSQLREVWRPSAEDVITGHAWGVGVPGTGSNLQELIEQAAAAMEGE